MKKIYFGLMLVLFQSTMQAAERACDSIDICQSGLIDQVQYLEKKSDIVDVLSKVSAIASADENNLLNIYNVKPLCAQQIQDLQVDLRSYDQNSIIQDFMMHPEAEYFSPTSRLPKNIKKLTFELMRTRAARDREPNSTFWQYNCAQYENAMYLYLQSGGVYFLYPEELILKQEQLQSLRQKFNVMSENQLKLLDRHAYVESVSQLLLQKKHDKEKLLQQSWQKIAHKLIAKEEQKSQQLNAAMVIQSCAKNYIVKSHVQKNSQILSENLGADFLQEFMQELVAEQMKIAKKENIAREYENFLGQKSNIFVDEIMSSALLELSLEQDAAMQKQALILEREKIEREKTKAKLKKARQKENKKQSALQQEQENALIANEIEKNRLALCEFERNQHLQRLHKEPSLTESHIREAMLGYDIQHLELFDDKNSIKDEQVVFEFLRLFTELLKLPFIDDLLLWENMIKDINNLDTKLKAKNKSLIDFVEDRKKLTELLCSKERDADEIKLNIMSTRPLEFIQKIRLEIANLDEKINSLKSRYQALPDALPLKKELYKKIIDLEERMQATRKHEFQHCVNCKHVKVIHDFKMLQNQGAPFSIFVAPLPAVDTIGLLTEADLLDCRFLLEKESAFWLQYDQEIDQEDLQRSLSELMKKVSLTDQDRTVFVENMSKAVMSTRNDIQPSLKYKQTYFYNIYKKDKVYGTLYDMNVLADVAKIESLLFEFYRKYKEQRTK